MPEHVEMCRKTTGSGLISPVAGPDFFSASRMIANVLLFRVPAARIRIGQRAYQLL